MRDRRRRVPSSSPEQPVDLCTFIWNKCCLFKVQSGTRAQPMCFDTSPRSACRPKWPSMLDHNILDCVSNIKAAKNSVFEGETDEQHKVAATCKGDPLSLVSTRHRSMTSGSLAWVRYVKSLNARRGPTSFSGHRHALRWDDTKSSPRQKEPKFPMVLAFKPTGPSSRLEEAWGMKNQTVIVRYSDDVR